MNTHARRTSTIAALALALAACSAEPSTPDAAAEMQSYDVQLANGALGLPDQLTANGPTLLKLQAADDGEHHLMLWRLNDDVSYDELFSLPEEDGLAFLDLVTVVGGNGGVDAGQQLDVIVDLQPGLYYAVDLPGGEEVAEKEFEVVAGDVDAVAMPVADWEIVLGPGRQINVPEGFDGSGVVSFRNADGEFHEGAIIGLTDGTTPDDLFEWFETQDGPPPAFAAGGGGAQSSGTTMVVPDLGLVAGDYLFICFIPGADFVPHAFSGMFTPFSIS